MAAILTLPGDRGEGKRYEELLPRQVTTTQCSRKSYTLVLLTFDFTSLAIFSFSVPSTVANLAAIVLFSWPAIESMLLEMPRHKHVTVAALSLESHFKTQKKENRVKLLLDMTQ